MFNLKSTIIFFVRYDKFKKCIIHKAVSVKAHCRKETISAWTGENKWKPQNPQSINSFLQMWLSAGFSIKSGRRSNLPSPLKMQKAEKGNKRMPSKPIFNLKYRLVTLHIFTNLKAKNDEQWNSFRVSRVFITDK